MTPEFKSKKVELPSIACAVDISSEDKLIAVGCYKSNSIISIFDLGSLDLIATLKETFFQCLDVKFCGINKKILFLAEEDSGMVNFCQWEIGSGTFEIISNYSAEFYPKRIELDIERNLVALFGRSLEIRDLITLEVKKRIDYNDDFVNGLFVPDARLVVEGVHPNQLYSYNKDFEYQVFQIPIEKCKEMTLSGNGGKLLLTNRGMKGVFMFETENLSRIHEDLFNDQSFNANFIFALDDELVVEIGRAGFNAIHLESGEFIFGLTYPGSSIVSVAVASQGGKQNCFCFSQENKTLFLVEIEND